MAKVTSSWARPIQGVSQQPEKIRREGQCTTQINMIPSVVDGLKKRIGTTAIDRILSTLHIDSKIHHYRRGEVEEYIIIIEPTSPPRIFSMDGLEHTVVITNGDYSSVTNPLTSLSLQTISDFTFIVNNTINTEMRGDVAPALINEALIYTQFATYGRTYQVKVNGLVEAEFTTPDGDLPEHISEVDTTRVASQLVAGNVWESGTQVGTTSGASEGYDINLDTYTHSEYTLPVGARHLITVRTSDDTSVNPSSILSDAGGDVITFPVGELSVGASYTSYYEIPTGGGLGTLVDFDVIQTGNVIHIKRTDGGSFTVDTVDGADGTDLIAVKGIITKTSLLPPYAPDDFKIKVQASGTSEDQAYWLRAIGVDGDTVKWVEDIAPEALIGFDKSTMPHVLVRDSIDEFGISTFTLREGDWIDRDVGDDESNPLPSFITTPSTPINSIGLIQNRIYVTSGEAVIMTRGDGNFFDFFRLTTQVAADTDPIDVYADSNQINNLLHSVVLDGDLVFFSPAAQFLMKGDQPLTKANATLKRTNTFKSQSQVSPVAAGENIFFPFSYGRFTGIREYFTDSITDTKRARPITEHVDQYLSGDVRHMATDPNNNWLVVSTDGAANKLYVYNWLWLGDEKVQSAWHEWEWDEDEQIRYMEFSSNFLYILIERPEGVYLESIDLGDPDSIGLLHPVRLDRQSVITATKVDDYFEWTDPLPDDDESVLEFVKTTGCYDSDKGTTVTFERIGGKIRTYDDLSDSTSCSLIAGRKYTSTYIPTPPVVKDYKDRVIGIDKLMMSRLFINYERTGHITVEITDRLDVTRSYSFNGRFFGAPNNKVGFAPLIDGQYQVPVMQKADRITITLKTDSHLPFQLRDIEWSGQFNQRGRRI